MTTGLSIQKRIELDSPLQEIQLVLTRSEDPVPRTVHGGEEVVALIAPHMQGLHREAFFVVPLNGAHRPLGIHMSSLGTPMAAPVHPREVFLPAVLAGASCIVVAHNHPSGDPAPSAQDELVTDRLREAGDLLGIEMLDHLIVGDGRYYSFAAGDSFLIRG